MLNNYYVNEVESVTVTEQAELEVKISLAIDKFIKITGKDLSNAQLFEFRKELREVFFEYLEYENIQACDIDSLDSLARVAFYRLGKASRAYFYEKNSSSSYEAVESLRKKANKYKRDYELIIISS